MQAAMSMAPAVATTSQGLVWAGRILSGLAVAFLAFDTVIKLIVIEPVVQSFQALGYSPSLAVGIGLLELACLVLYLVPRTSILGAILLTAYLGGAVATHTRVGNPLFSHILFPVYIGLMIWAGVYVRDGLLRALVPLRK